MRRTTSSTTTLWTPSRRRPRLTGGPANARDGDRRAAVIHPSVTLGARLRYNTAQAEVAEWQTRRSQKPLRATSWGFESPLRHHEPRRLKGRRGSSRPDLERRLTERSAQPVSG